MSPHVLSVLFNRLRKRLTLHSSDASVEITLSLPPEFDGELAFYRLVNWTFALVNEACKPTLGFLVSLPPLREELRIKKDVDSLRTYIAHNLNFENTRDARTFAEVTKWYRKACSKGDPRETADFVAACNMLAAEVRRILEGAIDACDLLDSEEDGPRLVDDLKSRIEASWAAHRFDPIVADVAVEFGNPGLDLVEFRKKRLEKWRKVVASAAHDERHRAVKIQIETDFLGEVGDRLPCTAKEAARRLSILDDAALVAALLVLRDVSRHRGKTVAQILASFVDEAKALHEQ